MFVTKSKLLLEVSLNPHICLFAILLLIDTHLHWSPIQLLLQPSLVNLPHEVNH